MKSSFPIPAAAPILEPVLLVLLVAADDAVLLVAETVIANPP
jgi:hypothetical protein